MNTRLLIRPQGDIFIDEFLIIDGRLAFTVRNFFSANFQEGIVLAIRYRSNSNDLNTIVVRIISITQSSQIITSLLWNGPLPTEGVIRNVLRFNESIADLDETFNCVVNQAVDDVLLLADGMYIGGRFTAVNGVSRNRIAKIRSDGSLDLSFNPGSGFSGGQVSVIKPWIDGKIYVGGSFTSYNGTPVQGIVRLNANGTLDTTFFGSSSGGALGITDILVKPDRLIIIGNFANYSVFSRERIATVNHFNDAIAAGMPQFSFIGFNATPRRIIEHNDKIYIVGDFTTYNGGSSNGIASFNSADSTINSSFVIGSGFNGSVRDIRPDENGRLIVVGGFTQYKGVTRNKLVGLNESGDVVFNNNFIPSSVDFINSVDFQRNGKLVTMGTADQSATNINRLLTNGNDDLSFLAESGFNNTGEALVDDSGRILVFGEFTEYKGQSKQFIARLKASRTSIVFEPYELDLREDESFPLNYSIADIREPQNRKSSFSKNIILPGTSHNNRILSQLFEIGADSTFDIRTKKDVIVLQDNTEIFNGKIKINRIIRDDWNTISYDVSLEGETSTLFNSLKNSKGEDLKLSDLDMREWDHPLNRTSILNSWTNQIVKNGLPYTNAQFSGIFPVIDTNFAPTARTKFLINDVPNPLRTGDIVRFNMDFPGAVNFDRSNGHHTVIGFLTPSNQLISDGLGDPVVNLSFQSGPTNSGELRKVFSLGEGYVYPTVYLGGLTGPTSSPIPNTSELISTQFQPYIYVHEYVRKIFKQIGFTYQSNFFNSDFFNRLIVESYSSFGSDSEVGSSSLNFNALGNTIIDIQNVIVDPTQYWNLANNIFTNGGSNRRPNIEISSTINANAYVPVASGWQIRLRVWRSLNPDGTPNAFFDSPSLGIFGNPLDDNGNSMQYVILSRDASFTGINIGQGVTLSGGLQGTYSFNIDWITLRPGERIRFSIEQGDVNTADFILSDLNIKITGGILTPTRDMTARDFLLSLINMFNLYIEPDKFNTRNVLIEPFDEYYLDQFIDWTPKVDISNPIEIEPYANLLPKTYKFSYDSDSDFLNKDYQDAWNEVYGEETYSNVTEFSDQTVDIKVKFANTPLSDERENGNVIVPALYKNQQRQRAESHKPRIFYWKGLTWAPNGFSIDGIDTNDVFGTSVYGYAGHLDNPLDATLDLSFGLLKRQYFGQTYQTLVTENTLFNRFYKNYIDGVTDDDSRLVKMWMKLNSSDIATLSFRRFYLINGIAYRLQKIIDYDPVVRGLTLCEFLKAKPVKPIPRPGEPLVCGEVNNGLTIEWVTTDSALLLSQFTADTLSYINNEGQGIPIEGAETIDMEQFGPGTLCLFGSNSEGLPYPIDSFGGEITSLTFAGVPGQPQFGSIIGFSMQDPTTLNSLQIDGTTILSTTLDLTAYVNLISFIYSDYLDAGTQVNTIDISTCTQLTQLSVFQDPSTINSLLVPSSMPDLFDLYIEGVSWTSSSQIDNIILALNPAVSGGNCIISTALAPFTYVPSIAADTRINELISNGWTVIIA